jgi:hypothetical protein
MRPIGALGDADVGRRVVIEGIERREGGEGEIKGLRLNNFYV